ncbi:MAG TPA: AI-2E family transporter [Patescibacteria group bacterium]|jgi:predicted PurR-regulated permease PerM|nr:AI-2E family transporter [Patescibacteria group bacterium]
MFEEIKKEFTFFKLLVFLLTIAVSIYLLGIFWQFLGNFSDVIIIALVAWLLSFILEPLVDVVSKLTRLAKLWSALIVYVFFAILFTAIVFILLPTVISQYQSLSTIIPKSLNAFPQFTKTWNNVVGHSFENLIGFLPSVATIFVDIIIILVLSFYLILDKEKISAEMYKLAPKNWHGNLKFVQETINETFASFLQIQVLFGVLAGITTWIVLRIFSIDFAASIAILAGLLTIIPLAGPLLGIVPPAFVVLVTHPENPLLAVAIAAILLLIQQITYNAVGPKLMEKAFKLHPIVVLLSILIGFKVAGAMGAVFVVPVLGIAVIVIKKLGYHFINPEETKN